MSVKIITDSTSDIPPDIARELDVTVVPIYVRFGDRVYRDGVDITTAEFYRMLATSPVHPATSQPTPEDFSRVYSEHAGKVDGIVSIHISSRISGTYNSALLARSMQESPATIEVVDSRLNSGGLALVVMEAARAARAQGSLRAVLGATHRAMASTEMLGMFDTMKYLARSGRVSRAIAAAGSILNVKPLLTFRDGEIVRAGMARTVSKAMDRLHEFVASRSGIGDLVLVHSDAPELAEGLKQRLEPVFQHEKALVLELGVALGVHGGPGVLLVAVRRSDSS